jgi:uncharacterized protein DUF932
VTTDILADIDAAIAVTDQAAKTNYTYALAGAEATAEQAAAVGQVSLSDWDRYELEKMYPTQEAQAAYLARLQGAEVEAAKRRVEYLQRDQQRRSDMIGGLAWSADFNLDELNLDDLSDDQKLQLPWHVRFTGPAGNGVTAIRKDWTDPEQMLKAAKLWGWDVHTVGVGKRGNKNLIVRQAIPEYAETCRCPDFHGRPGEVRETDADGNPAPLCAWLVEDYDLGLCYSAWKPEPSPEDLVEVLGAFTESGEVIPSSAGWLDGGERIFVQMRLAESRFLFGPGTDAHRLYIGVHQHYTGHGAGTVHLSGVREACDNTTKLAERQAVAKGRFIHVGKVGRQIVHVGEEIARAAGYWDAYAKAQHELALTKLTLADLNTAAEALIEGNPNSDRAKTALANRRADFVGLVLSDETVPDELRRTGFGLSQTTSRWFGNLAPSNARSDTARLNSVWEPDGAAVTKVRQVRKLVQTIGGKTKTETVKKRSAR